MNPVDEFLMEKESGLGDVWKALKSGLTLEDIGKFRGALGRDPGGSERIMHQVGTRATQGGLMAGMLGAAGLGMKGVEGLYDAATSGRQHRQEHEAMLAAHPSLREEDPEQVAMAFRSVKNLAPALASDPLAAGSVVRNLLAYGRTEQGLTMPPETAKMLTETQRNLSGGKGAPNPVLDAFGKGLLMPGAKGDKATIVNQMYDPSIAGHIRETIDPHTGETLYQERMTYDRPDAPGEVIGHHGGPYKGG
jgi:hypothetical protein